jgi:hypothetical protein
MYSLIYWTRCVLGCCMAYTVRSQLLYSNCALPRSLCSLCSLCSLSLPHRHSATLSVLSLSYRLWQKGESFCAALALAPESILSITTNDYKKWRLLLAVYYSGCCLGSFSSTETVAAIAVCLSIVLVSECFSQLMAIRTHIAIAVLLSHTTHTTLSMLSVLYCCHKQLFTGLPWMPSIDSGFQLFSHIISCGQLSALMI